MMGDRTSLLDMTCIRNTSAIDRLIEEVNATYNPGALIYSLEVCPIKSRDQNLEFCV